MIEAQSQLDGACRIPSFAPLSSHRLLSSADPCASSDRLSCRCSCNCNCQPQLRHGASSMHRSAEYQPGLRAHACRAPVTVKPQAILRPSPHPGVGPRRKPGFQLGSLGFFMQKRFLPRLITYNSRTQVAFPLVVRDVQEAGRPMKRFRLIVHTPMETQ